MTAETAIYSIDTPRPKYPFIPDVIPTDEPVSVHVVDGEKTILIGSGYATGAAELLRQLAPIGDPDVVIIEHGDPDHYDAVPLFRYLFDDPRVVAPEGDRDTLRDVGITVDDYIQHDDVLHGLRAIHVPGHTPGNMSFLHEPTGTLFAGDSIVHSSSPNAAQEDWSGPFAMMKPALNADDDLARDSIEVLREYQIRSARLTHGPNVDDAESALETFLQDLGR